MRIKSAMDPLFIQPATLEIANVRKKPTEELGITIYSTYGGVHIISSINTQVIYVQKFLVYV